MSLNMKIRTKYSHSNSKPLENVWKASANMPWEYLRFFPLLLIILYPLEDKHTENLFVFHSSIFLSNFTIKKEYNNACHPFKIYLHILQIDFTLGRNDKECWERMRVTAYYRFYHKRADLNLMLSLLAVLCHSLSFSH